MEASRLTAKGVGIVRPRRRGTDRAICPVAFDTLSLKPPVEGARDAHLPPRFPSYLLDGELPRCDLTKQDEAFRAMTLIRNASPVILEQAPLIAPTDIDVAAALCTGECEVWMSGIRKCRFMKCNLEKNVYGTGYHVREPEMLIQQMTLAEFRKAKQTWQQWSLHLTVDPQSNEIDQHQGAATPDARNLRSAQTRRAIRLTAQLQEWFDEGWLLRCMEVNDWKAVISAELHLGSVNAVFPAHYRTNDVVISPISGQLRVLLISPAHAFNGLYPFPVHHPYDGYSMVDFDHVDDQRWPNFRKVRGACRVLGPGDLLVIPQYWFAHLHALDSDASWLHFEMASDTKLRAEDCIPLQAGPHALELPPRRLLQLSRYVEDYAVMMQDIPHSREWLQRLAQNSELCSIDLGTVTGSQRLELVERIKEEIELNLGAVSLKPFLEKLCDGRLLPTPWLNQDCREPMYLKDKPVVIEDKRTEEQIKYPEFFKHLLPSP